MGEYHQIEPDHLFFWEWREREKYGAKSPIYMGALGAFAGYAPGSSETAQLRFNCPNERPRCPFTYRWPPSVPVGVSRCILDAGHIEKDCVCEETLQYWNGTLPITYRMTNLQTPCDGTPCHIEIIPRNEAGASPLPVE
jgi:hypothetical protein